jgi:hypothetical protein
MAKTGMIVVQGNARTRADRVAIVGV